MGTKSLDDEMRIADTLLESVIHAKKEMAALAIQMSSMGEAFNEAAIAGHKLGKTLREYALSVLEAGEE